MAKLTKPEIRAHEAACKLLEQDRLSEDEKLFVLQNWHEGACHMNSKGGAFFTPPALAQAFSLEVSGERIIDLCAGIGMLSFFARPAWSSDKRDFVCVEINPDYVAVGRKILPEATWICGDIFDLPADLGRFDMAIANSPFGATARTGNGHRYSGRQFEYHAIAVASRLAKWGTFLIPQGSAPFCYSGRQGFESVSNEQCERFTRDTGISLGSNAGIDTKAKGDDDPESLRWRWRGVAPVTEIVTVDFDEEPETDAEAIEAPAEAPSIAAGKPRQLALI